MKKMHINLKNCYGIKKLEYEFDFSKKNAFLIYAPNGSMKTSFAKTFRDLSNEMESNDLMFPERKTVREITDENKLNIIGENVFVIEPYLRDYESEKISSLIANSKLKKEYEKIHSDIEHKKENFVKQVGKWMGIKNDVEGQLLDILGTQEIYEGLEKIEKELKKVRASKLDEINYTEIFNNYVIPFLSQENVKELLKEYIEKYNQLVENSIYFKRGVFDHTNAQTVSKHLKSQGFFDAKHSLTLKSDVETKEISTTQELEVAIAEEKTKIMSDQDLREKFEKIDAAISRNANLRRFRTYLEENMFLISELMDLDTLKSKLWLLNIKKEEASYHDLLNIYKSGKVRLDKIIKEARKEATDWEKVVDIFNKRFIVPFRLEIVNKEDVILNEEAPAINFVFEDFDEEKETNNDDLLEVLSTGERKALYILNIIYEIEARKKESTESIFIVDDIADSFDYKNKYAIIEYLKEISEEKYFYQIILTHNFDFYRTVRNRILGTEKWNNALIAQKNNSDIKLLPGGSKNVISPFENWKDNLDNNKMMISSIPFVRNLIEFKEGCSTQEYNTLTSVLHIKSNSDTIKLIDIEKVFNSCLKGADMKLDKNTKDLIIQNVIFTTAHEICKQKCEDTIALENKIVLSIAARLKAESYMWDKVKTKDEFSKNQTGLLFERFKKECCADSNMPVLERVILMTPENIHLNSFMYEPILDMSEDELRQLYDDVKIIK